MPPPDSASHSTHSHLPSGDGSALLIADANLPTVAVLENATGGTGASNVCTEHSCVIDYM